MDLTGQRFGRLTVIKRIYPNNKYNITMWLCKCDCGNKVKVDRGRLRAGHTKSCGCLHLERLKDRLKLTYGLASMRRTVRKYKRNAKKRGLEYKLTDEQFKEITQRNCFYCGAKPGNINKPKHCNGEYIYNGIDRVDNNKGYTIDNVVACCRFCNYRKGALPFPEFKAWIEKVYVKLVKYTNRGIIK